MRYFIEVKAVAEIHPEGDIIGEVHARKVFNELCGRPAYPFMKEVDAPVTCKRCLAILEKQGRSEE